MKKLIIVLLFSLISVLMFSQRVVNSGKFLVYNDVVGEYFVDGDTLIDNMGVVGVDMKLSGSKSLKLFFRLVTEEVVLMKYPNYVGGSEVDVGDYYIKSLYYSEDLGYISICEDSHTNLLYIDCGGIMEDGSFPRRLYVRIK